MARSKKVHNINSNDTNVSSIISITSASVDWNAVFYDSKGDTWFEKIACFALCEKSGYKFVGSVISKDTEGLSVAEDCPNFLGISPPDDECSWNHIARKKLNGGKKIAKMLEDDDDELEVEHEVDDDDDELEDAEPEDDDTKPKVVSKRRNIR